MREISEGKSNDLLKTEDGRKPSDTLENWDNDPNKYVDEISEWLDNELPRYKRMARAGRNMSGMLGSQAYNHRDRISPENMERIRHEVAELRNLERIAGTIAEADALDGHDFEYWCADLLRRNSFIKVEVTKGSGDQGVDVLAEKDGIKYAIQCKCYTSDLGNTPIQEVHAGKYYYGCQVSAVMTNRHFTAGARELAEKTGVLLWDRDKLIEMLSK